MFSWVRSRSMSNHSNLKLIPTCRSTQNNNLSPKVWTHSSWNNSPPNNYQRIGISSFKSSNLEKHFARVVSDNCVHKYFDKWWWKRRICFVWFRRPLLEEKKSQISQMPKISLKFKKISPRWNQNWFLKSGIKSFFLTLH